MFLILYLQILINGSCVSYAQSDQPHVNIRNFVLQCPTYLFADYAETYCLKVESKGKGVTTMRSFSTEGGYCKLLEKKTRNSSHSSVFDTEEHPSCYMLYSNHNFECKRELLDKVLFPFRTILA